MGAYRSFVDERDGQVDSTASARNRARFAQLVELGLQHEQQHQELMLMDIKHVFSRNPLAPAYDDELRAWRAHGDAAARSGSPIEGGLIEIGTSDNDSFCFDNESPRHKVWLEPFRIGEPSDHLRRVDRLHRRRRLSHARRYGSPTAGRPSIENSGRRRSTGSATATSGRCSPSGGLRPVDPAEPVVHVSYYEADAFARWAGAPAADRGRMGARGRPPSATRTTATSCRAAAAPRTACPVARGRRRSRQTLRRRLGVDGERLPRRTRASRRARRRR